MTVERGVEDLEHSMSEAEAATYRNLNERLDAMDETIVRIRAGVERIVHRMRTAGVVIDPDALKGLE